MPLLLMMVNISQNRQATNGQHIDWIYTPDVAVYIH